MIRLTLFVTMVLFAGYVSGQTLKGKIYYDLGHSKTILGASLKVYLIPNTTENARVITQSSNYDRRCNETTLKTARDHRVAITDKGGYYFFTNVKAGKYLLKICTDYGGYYTFTIRSNFTGTFNLPDFEADPPIK